MRNRTRSPLWSQSAPMAVKVTAMMLLVATFTFLPPLDKAEANHDCVVNNTILDCPMHLQGQHSYYVNGNPVLVLRLRNNTGQAVQINSIQATPVVTNLFGEYCATRDVLSTGQNQPGIGEVGCVHKEPSEPGYLPLRWDGVSTALSVPPNSVIYIGGHLLPTEDRRHTFTVTTAPETVGVNSWRQPRQDQVISCNGATQFTVWGPWKNTTTNDIWIGGATIFGYSSFAQIYILDVNGNVRWAYNQGVNARGVVDFANQRVHPGEFIAGQASHSCPVGQSWDWAAYIYTWPAG